MTYEEFAKEVKDRWAFGLALVPNLWAITLNPEERDVLSTFLTFVQFLKWRDATFSEPPKVDDHPMIADVKNRLVDLVQEGRDLGFY